MSMLPTTIVAVVAPGIVRCDRRFRNEKHERQYYESRGFQISRRPPSSLKETK
jgi:hypothetical protein